MVGLHCAGLGTGGRGSCTPRSPKARDRGHPDHDLERSMGPGPPAGLGSVASIPGPQMRGTGATLSFWLWDRGHPPPDHFGSVRPGPPAARSFWVSQTWATRPSFSNEEQNQYRYKINRKSNPGVYLSLPKHYKRAKGRCSKKRQWPQSVVTQLSQQCNFKHKWQESEA
jgi:hypothetical protein